MRSRSADDEAYHRDLLSRIAGLLGEPVDSFFAPPGNGALAQTAELLQLWLVLETEEQRRYALELVRRLAAH